MNHFYKQFYKNGTLRQYKNENYDINKNWYPNGKLKWDLCFDELYYLGAYFNTRNKSWYPNGQLKSIFKLGIKDTVIRIDYYESGSIKVISKFLTNVDKSKSDGVKYPIEYIIPNWLSTEYFCENGTRIYYRGKPSDVEWFEHKINGYRIKNVKHYYCNGTLRYQSEFCDIMQPYGRVITYYLNSSIEYDVYFPYDDNDKKPFERKRYDRNGILIEHIIGEYK